MTPITPSVFIPLGPGKLLFLEPKDEDGTALSGGSGTIDWYNDDSGIAIAIGVAITWNSAKSRYQTQIEDQSVWDRAVGDLWRGVVLIDADTPSAKRYRDELRARVKAPSSAL